MKKLAALLLSVLLVSFAGAYQLPYTNTYYNNNVFHEELNNSSEAQAQMLCDLGLFKGRGEGDFALDSTMTREEAAAMVVRFLGGEKESETGSFSHPFTDVSPWADPYVGWLYENGFTKGISAEKYGGKNLVTCWQYSTFLSRAVRGSEQGIATEEEVKFYDENGLFCRETAVGLSVRAFMQPYDRVDSMKTCAQYLCEQGVFTARQLRSAAVNVIPSAFGHDQEDYFIRKTAGVTVAKAPMPGAQMVVGSEKSPRDYVCVTVKTAGEMTLYALDFRTLEVRFSAAYGSENARDMTYLGSFGSKDFLLEQLEGGFAGGLYAVNGTELETVVSAEDLWKGENTYFYQITWKNTGDALTLAGTEGLFLVTEQGVSFLPVAEKAELLGVDGKAAALQTVGEAETVIFCVDLERKTVTDEYRIAYDAMGARTVGAEKWYDEDGKAFYGTAGYYVLRSGRLLQVTDMPTAKTVSRRVGAGGETVILCHDVGERRNDYMGRPTGSKLYSVDTYTHALTPFMELKPHWNVRVDELWSMDSAVCFSTRTPVGMDHYDTYTYVILNGKLLPQNYEAGRSEFMTKSQELYTREEMGRLYALGAAQSPGGEILSETDKTVTVRYETQTQTVDVTFAKATGKTLTGKYDHTVYGEPVQYLFGEGGLYKVQKDKTAELTQMPVLQMEFFRSGPSYAMALVSRDEKGNAQIYSAWDWGDGVLDKLTLHYTCLPEHGISNITLPKNTESLQFCAEASHGTYTYLLGGTAEKPNVWPVGYKAKDPSAMTKTWSEYLWEEIDRLHALGISDARPTQ